MSQREIAAQLAERTGFKITYKQISRYERDRSAPPIETILAYGRAANVEMAQIVDDDLDLRFSQLDTLARLAGIHIDDLVDDNIEDLPIKKRQ